MTTQLESYALTRGGETPPNHDRHLRDDERGLYVVSDGVGAHPGSELASEVVVRALSGALLGDWPDDAQARARWLAGALRRTARTLHERGQERPEHRDMAATATLLALRPDRYLLLHIGDSRAYRWRDGALVQLSDDHSLAWEQYRLGALTRAEVRTHPNQKLLTRTLSARRSFAVGDVAEGERRDGDVFLLCSDGLTKVLDDESIALGLASTGGDPRAACRRLFDLGAASVDDLTVVVVA